MELIIVGIALSWDLINKLANVDQLIRPVIFWLIYLIVKAFDYANNHEEKRRRLANLLLSTDKLLDELDSTDLMRYPDTQKILEDLREGVGKAYNLVYSCENICYPYLLVSAWAMSRQLKQAEKEVHRYLNLCTLMNAAGSHRNKGNSRGRYSPSAIEKKKMVFKLPMEDVKSKIKAMEAAADAGAELIETDIKEGKMTVEAKADPVRFTLKLREMVFGADLVELGPAKEEGRLKERTGKKDIENGVRSRFSRLRACKRRGGIQKERWGPCSRVRSKFSSPRSCQRRGGTQKREQILGGLGPVKEETKKS